MSRTFSFFSDEMNERKKEENIHHFLVLVENKNEKKLLSENQINDAY